MRLLLLASLLSSLVACGTGGDGTTDDGGGMGGDAGATRDAGTTRDSGVTDCPSGQHLCGGGCIDDLENAPENGCRLGCSEACPVPDLAMATCTAGGTCDFECIPPATRDGGLCACTPRTCAEQDFECGEQTDGCGMSLDCGTCEGGGSCTDGRCGCVADSAEVNDDRATAHSLGMWTDSSGPMMTFDTFAISSDMDEDWFVLDVVDGTDGANPDIDVTLYGIPAGSNYDLQVWFVCGASDEEVTCNAGMPDNMIGQGCASASSGTTSETVRLAVNCTGVFTSDDSGTAYVRVTPSAWASSCAPYSLDVHVH